MLLKFRFLVPIEVHPSFWLFAALAGFLLTGNVFGMVNWIIVIFFSVLIHELGHAAVAKHYGCHPKIQITAFGGLTSHQPHHLSLFRQFMIVAAGPLFGLLLFVVSFVLLFYVPYFSTGIVANLLDISVRINLFWTLLNLVPTAPLDGGKILSIILRAILGFKGIKIAHIVGMVVSVLLALACFAFGSYFIGAIFFLFFYQSFEFYKASKNMVESDEDVELQRVFKKGQKSLYFKHPDHAKESFEKIVERHPGGVIEKAAAFSLAHMIVDEDPRRAYELLLPFGKQLEGVDLLLFVKLAFEFKDTAIVRKYAAEAFKISQDPELALHAAASFAEVGDLEPTLGWLDTALSLGVDIKPWLKNPLLEGIAKQASFQLWLKKRGEA